MAVYVDNMAVGFRGMIMCHMIADTREELLEMADKIGVHRKWIQYPYTAKEHFDVCKSKRQLAYESGAIQISCAELARKILEKKKNAQVNP